MSTPDLHIRTCFVLDDDGRIIGTREPSATRGPLFTLVKSQETCAWAVRADVPPAVAKELNELAQDEPPALDPRQLRFIRVVISLFFTGEFRQTNGPKGRPLSQMVRHSSSRIRLFSFPTLSSSKMSACSIEISPAGFPARSKLGVLPC